MLEIFRKKIYRLSATLFAIKIPMWSVGIPFRFHARFQLFSVMLMTIFVGKQGIGSQGAIIVLFASQNIIFMNILQVMEEEVSAPDVWES